MPTGKRASMREGPLAALFRKTAEDTAAGTPAQEESGTAAERAAASEQSPPAPEPQPSVPAPEATPVADEPEQPQHVLSPQERLRHVFSSDIPENMLEREAPPEPEPEPDV